MRSFSLEEASRHLRVALARWTAHDVAGIRCWLGPEQLPLGQVAVRWPVGFVDEEDREAGYAHLAEHVLFRGSPGRIAREDDLLRVGGTTNGRTNSQSVRFWSTAPAGRLDLALTHELSRYDEAVPAAWALHQARVIRAEILDKTRGDTASYAWLNRAVEHGPAEARRLDGFSIDAVATGLAGFGRFLDRAFRRPPALALSGYADGGVLEQVAGLLRSELMVRLEGAASLAPEPAVGSVADERGSAAVFVIREPLGILERALLDASARALSRTSAGVHLQLHLWGDAITEATTPPFVLLQVAAAAHREAALRSLGSLSADEVRHVVERAVPSAARAVTALAGALSGVRAAETFSALLERTTTGAQVVPRVEPEQVAQSIAGTERLLTAYLASLRVDAA